jgi:hypothetical protein
LTALPLPTVVILQPQFFPWRGVFEQIRLADTFLHLDDAQFQKGGFTNRVQIKTDRGSMWLTVPVLRSGSLPLINETTIDYKTHWREKHLRTLESAYARAPHARMMLGVVQDVYAARPETIADLDIIAIEAVCQIIGCVPVFSRTSQTPTPLRQTERLVELLRPHAPCIYVTGHGALAYLDESLMQSHGIDVRVMDYQRTPYPQLHGTFDPHVTILDLLANTGAEARDHLDSPAIPWNAAKALHTESR